MSKGWMKSDFLWQIALRQTWKYQPLVSKLNISAIPPKQSVPTNPARQPRRRAATVRIDMVKELLALPELQEPKQIIDKTFKKETRPTVALNGFQVPVEDVEETKE